MRHKLEARLLLLRHYWLTFRHHWRHRDRRDGELFTVDETEFLPAALEIQEKPVSPSLRMTAALLCLIFLVTVGWSVLGHLDIVVNAAGEIIPHERTKTIASVQIASVKALHVVEGQRVKKGDLLIELDASEVDAEHAKAESGVVEARLQTARSLALVTAIEQRVPPRLPPVPGVAAHKRAEAQRHLDDQYREFTARLQRIEGEIARYEGALPLLTQRALDYKELSGNHDVSVHAYLEKEQARVDLEGQLAEARNQRAALIAEARRMANDVRIDADKTLGGVEQDARRTAAHGRLLRLVAPVDGTVQQLTVHTVGGVVPAAQELMKIVPREQTIEIEAFLENKDIGFIEVGQAASVKIDAYEYTKFGVIPARVAHVSPDAVKDDKRGLLYSVILALDRTSIPYKGQLLPLNAGMSVRAEIKTGSRRVIEYFLNPLLQHKRESLNER